MWCATQIQRDEQSSTATERRDYKGKASRRPKGLENMRFCETNRIGFSAFSCVTRCVCDGYTERLQKLNPVRLAKPSPFEGDMWASKRQRGTAQARRLFNAGRTRLGGKPMLLSL